MGIVLAGFAQIIMPLLVVVPGMIFFAMHPEILLLPWEEVRPEADKTFVHMVQTLVPVGLRGLVLAALFGAIQSMINSVLNSTATIITLDFYKRLIRPSASGNQLVRVGIATSVTVLVVAIVLAGFIGRFGSLFVYIQTLYAFFAPPFAAVFLLGILWRRINSAGATTAVLAGFAFGIAIKLFIHYVPSHPAWLEPFGNQAAINWSFCVIACVAVSLLTPRPPAEKITDQLIVNWKKLNIFDNLREDREAWVRRVILPALKPVAEVSFARAACRREEIDEVVADYEAAGLDAILVICLTYSPSQLAVPALKRTRLPILLWNTQELFGIGRDFDGPMMIANHGVHGTQDLANVLLRSAVRFRYVTSHVQYPQGISPLAEFFRVAAGNRGQTARPRPRRR